MTPYRYRLVNRGFKTIFIFMQNQLLALIKASARFRENQCRYYDASCSPIKDISLLLYSP